MNDYITLIKPGIIFGNLMTLTAGFILASQGLINVELFLITLIGLTLIMASGCVFNNYIDKTVDKKMIRTRERALVTGIISNKRAIAFGMFLYMLGNIIFLSGTNILTFFLANIGFIIYVCIYSQVKTQTIYATGLGSIAGAVPPIVGYCAVAGKIDLGAILLFAMMVTWQMPHFFAIAILHLKDYTAAEIKTLPIVKGLKRTKIHMIFYIISFFLITILLTYYDFTGYLFLICAFALSFSWLWKCLKGFKNENEQAWGKQMFHFSLITIAVLCFLVPIDLYMKLHF